MIVAAASLALAAPAFAASVTYPARLHTSKGNPVTHVLILESDAAGQVHASTHGDVSGSGVTVLRHEVPFAPVHSLIIGLTEGEDEAGSAKTQLIIFANPDFVAASDGVPFSTAFPGARHGNTIERLERAYAGDAGELAWFTDTFFDGPAAAAVFASDGRFAVTEFTNGTPIGGRFVTTPAPVLGPGALSLLVVLLVGLRAIRARAASR